MFYGFVKTIFELFLKIGFKNINQINHLKNKNQIDLKWFFPSAIYESDSYII